MSLIIPLIEKATISIDILAYNWSFKEWERGNAITGFTQAIMKAKKRGVIVRAVLNAESRTHYITRTNSRTIQKISSVGVQAKLTPTQPITHSKLIIIDHQLSVLGSHNLTARSVTSNDETSVIIDSTETAAIFTNYFNQINGRL
jgi:phosphatidylserine/phosphatidylglycerophosphate/cardiolipin synthase-like enzyme